MPWSFRVSFGLCTLLDLLNFSVYLQFCQMCLAFVSFISKLLNSDVALESWPKKKSDSVCKSKQIWLRIKAALPLNVKTPGRGVNNMSKVENGQMAILTLDWNPKFWSEFRSETGFGLEIFKLNHILIFFHTNSLWFFMRPSIKEVRTQSPKIKPPR